jgi:UDP-N-acetylmuramoyl-tripeptide--D-alanyl-D-alanine ligase
MLELGDAEKMIHAETGKQLAASGIDFLIGVRGLAKDLVESADGSIESRFFDDSNAAGEFLSGEIRAGDLVLIKGSRGVRTEKVVEKLLEKYKLEE